MAVRFQLRVFDWSQLEGLHSAQDLAEGAAQLARVLFGLCFELSGLLFAGLEVALRL